MYIFGHINKSADTDSWLSSLKITLLQRSQSRNASSVFHRLLMPPGEMRQASHSQSIKGKPVTRQKPSSALRSVYKCDECQCVLACQFENKSSTWPLTQKADSPVQHLLRFEKTPSLPLLGTQSTFMTLMGVWLFLPFPLPVHTSTDRSCGLAS